MHKTAIFCLMKVSLLTISLLLSQLLWAAEPVMKYECITGLEEVETHYLMESTEKVADEEQITVFLASKQQVDTQDFADSERFIIKEKSEDNEFITHSNKIQINPETVGEARLEMDLELTLKHIIMLSVESCGADYTEENCLRESIYKCHKPLPAIDDLDLTPEAN